MKCKLLQEGERCLKELHAEPQKLCCYCWQSAIILFLRPALGPNSLLLPAAAPTLPCPGWELAGACRRGGTRPGCAWPPVGTSPSPLRHPTTPHQAAQAARGCLPQHRQQTTGKKYNTRDDSGWQINKLALITLWVSNTYFSHACQWWLLSCFGPTLLIPMPPDPRDPLAAWQGPARGTGHSAQHQTCLHGQRGSVRQQGWCIPKMRSQEPQWCEGCSARASLRLPFLGLGSSSPWGLLT